MASSSSSSQGKHSLPRNVWILGLVSLFNDIASEMIYPIVPIFLTRTLGASAAIVGIIEGIAEATASVLKVFSGWLSDRFRHRKKFVIAGYALSALAKLVLSLASIWWHVLGARFIDRFGKGTRTAARDALIADSTAEHQRGAAFGMHRAMDTLGAIIGPLLALALLHFLGERFTLIFLLAFFPGLLALGLLFWGVKEPPRRSDIQRLTFRLSLQQFTRPFKHFLLVSLVFALGNSSDAFLILRAQSMGYTTTQTVFLYVLFNLFFAGLAYPIGRLSDRLGARRVLLGSFFFFGTIYLGFALASGPRLLIALFPLYGIYMAMSEGISKAYITQIVPENIRATALGTYYTLTGLITFFASSLAGLMWHYLDVRAPFYFGAGMAFLAGILFLPAYGRKTRD
ncbi:MAG: MFS transporter [Calditrichaeota bacterium]|nr:MFS transporter [Calditrichota bacterium]